MKNKRNDQTNLQHDASTSNNDSYFFQVWIEREGTNLAKFYGIEDAVDGDICGIMQTTPEIFAKAKAGEINGFSIEIYFDEKVKRFNASISEDLNKQKIINDDMNFIEKLMKFISDEITVAPVQEVAKKFAEYVLETGEAVKVDEASKVVTIADAPAKPGEYKLNDGSVLVVDEAGLFVEVKAADAAPAEAPAKQAEVAPFTEADLTEIKAQFSEMIKAENAKVAASHKKEIEKFEAENKALKAEVSNLKIKLNDTPLSKIDVDKKEDKKTELTAAERFAARYLSF